MGWSAFLIAVVVADMVLCIFLGLACMVLGYGMRRHTTSGVHGVGCHAQAVSAGMPDTRCEPAVSGIDATVSGTEATVGGVEATVGGMPAPRHAGLGMPPAS